MFSIAVYIGIYAVIIINPFQFLFELLSIYLVKIKYSGEKPNENCSLISW